MKHKKRLALILAMVMLLAGLPAMAAEGWSYEYYSYLYNTDGWTISGMGDDGREHETRLSSQPDLSKDNYWRLEGTRDLTLNGNIAGDIWLDENAHLTVNGNVNRLEIGGNASATVNGSAEAITLHDSYDEISGQYIYQGSFSVKKVGWVSLLGGEEYDYSATPGPILYEGGEFNRLPLPYEGDYAESYYIYTSSGWCREGRDSQGIWHKSILTGTPDFTVEGIYYVRADCTIAGDVKGELTVEEGSLTLNGGAEKLLMEAQTTAAVTGRVGTLVIGTTYDFDLDQTVPVDCNLTIAGGVDMVECGGEKTDFSLTPGTITVKNGSIQNIPVPYDGEWTDFKLLYTESGWKKEGIGTDGKWHSVNLTSAPDFAEKGCVGLEIYHDIALKSDVSYDIYLAPDVNFSLEGKAEGNVRVDSYAVFSQKGSVEGILYVSAYGTWVDIDGNAENVCILNRDSEEDFTISVSGRVGNLGGSYWQEGREICLFRPVTLEDAVFTPDSTLTYQSFLSLCRVDASGLEEGESMAVFAFGADIPQEMQDMTDVTDAAVLGAWRVALPEGKRQVTLYVNCGDNAAGRLLTVASRNKNGVTLSETVADRQGSARLTLSTGLDLVLRDAPQVEGWRKVDRSWYYFKDGVCKTGWIKEGTSWYYLDQDGIMQTGWQKVSGQWYCFNASGVMQTGWQKLGGVWYYFNQNGAMQSGWLKINGQWYYFNSSGVMQTGWQKLGGVWYYFNQSGAMQSGWLQISGQWYYFNASGAMQTGWQKVGGVWYYFNQSGAMQSGWVQSGGKWYYMNASGTMQTGWQKVGGVWYCFDKNGVMQTGWVQSGNDWYYLNADGSLKTGWLQSGGKWYYLDPAGGGRMVKNTRMKIDGKWYRFDANGVWKS